MDEVCDSESSNTGINFGCEAYNYDAGACNDCLGVFEGNAWESDCGCVDGDNSGDDCDDCAGTPNGD